MQGRKSLFAAPLDEESEGAAEQAASSDITPTAARPSKPALRAVVVKVVSSKKMAYG
jgi:hypothetical protein